METRAISRFAMEHLMRERASKRVLVTGGAGFIGSHLIDRLIEDGHEVICADNLSTGREGNLAHLAREPRFHFILHDVVSTLDVRIDEIYNLASPASLTHCDRDPLYTLRTNVEGAIKLAELAVRCDASIVQASTSEIYGDPDIHPQSESYWGNVNPIGPRAPYDEGKRCAETIFAIHARVRPARVKVARIFNTYGPRLRPDDGRVVPNLILQALSGAPMTIHGDGRQTRSLCYVDDLVDGLLRLMAFAKPLGPLNLGNPHEVSINALAAMIQDLTGTTADSVFIAMPVDSPRRRRPDISLAMQRLNWCPKIPLVVGLRSTIADLVQHTRDRCAAE